jgi:methyl-accepting chemotaxis protein
LYRKGFVSHELRRKGFEMALLQKSPGVQVVVALDCPTTQEGAFAQTLELLRDYPALGGVYVTLGSVPPAVAKAIENQGKAGQVKIVCHDFAEETMNFVARGVITATLSEEAFTQGHDSVIHLFNRLVAGWTPQTPRLLTQPRLATQENCAQLLREASLQAATGATDGTSAKPISRRAERPLRIAVLGRAPNSFWDQVKAGVQAAAAEVRPYNASVDWIVPEQTLRDRTVSVAVYGPLLESLIQQGYDGVATAVFDPEFVPYVNRATQAGLPVVTFDSEPSGLSSMVLMITEQATRLMELSEGLARAVNQVTQATSQIRSAMEQVSQGTVVQTEKVSLANGSLDSLLHGIDGVVLEANAGAAAAEKAGQAARVSTTSVATTLGSMEGVRRSVTETAAGVEQLGASSERIDEIVKLIGGIAYQIKLLGINAAIEAAHAGDYGAGFSVVAREIRSLGERSSQAAKEIAGVVEKVKESIYRVLRGMRAELQQVQTGAGQAQQASKLLEDIGQAVEGNGNRLVSIAKASTQLQTLSHDLGAAIQELTTIAEENAASAEEVGASTSEVLTELDAVSQSAKSLANMASGALRSLAKFDTSQRAL